MHRDIPTTFERRITGASMILAPLVFVIAELLHAHFETDPAPYLDGIAANPDRWYGAHMLVLLGLALMLPATFGAARLLRAMRPSLGNLGVTLVVPGVVALAALVGMELVAWQLAQSGISRVDMVTLWEKSAENEAIAPLVLNALLLPVAWLLVGVGLYVTRAVPRWIAALVALAQLVGFVGELAGAPKWLAVGAQIAFAVGLIPIGLRVVRAVDESSTAALSQAREATASR